jgi:hypothetical protein
MTNPVTTETRERFEESYVPEPNTGCWIFLGSLSSKKYGRFRRCPRCRMFIPYGCEPWIEPSEPDDDYDWEDKP